MLRTRVTATRTATLFTTATLAALLAVLHCFELFVPALALRSGEAPMLTVRLPTRNGEPPAVIARRQIPYGRIAERAVALDAHRRAHAPGLLIGHALVLALASGIALFFLRRHGPSSARLLRAQIGVVGMVIALTAVSKAILLIAPVSVFLLPAALIPIWAAAQFDRRSALAVTALAATAIAGCVDFDLAVIMAQLSAGAVAALLVAERAQGAKLLFAGLSSGVASAVSVVAVRLAISGHFDVVGDLSQGLSSVLVAALASGAVTGGAAWLFQGIATRAFGGVTRNQLTELCSLERPLLKKMAAEAPGSWQHARAMANLAEGAAAAIGADAALTRAGAYYHDLGKTLQPKYFVENLEPGERSPHEDLDPGVSADAIMAHVVGGTKILRDGAVPEPVVEFAYTHHGTSVIEYFWHKCLQQGNPKNLKQDAFRYPGMKPLTRETAILMLIDAIEAASRTIDPPDHDKFEEMIQRVIFSKMKQGQLDEAGLTAADLRVLINSIADTLVSVYHHRIKYPWQQKSGGGEVDAVPANATGKLKAVEKATISSKPIVVGAPADKPAAPPPEKSSTLVAASVPPPPMGPADTTLEAEAVDDEPVEGPRASDPPPPPEY